MVRVARRHLGDLLPCIPETPDRAVLDSLYNATGGENWRGNENWLTDRSLNTWSGIATDGEGHVTEIFFFTIPIEDGWENSLERITLAGPEGEVTVDSGDRRSITVVTDPSTGRIRAILRDWEGPLPAALGDTDGLEVETTRGILEAVRLR